MLLQEIQETAMTNNDILISIGRINQQAHVYVNARQNFIHSSNKNASIYLSSVLYEESELKRLITNIFQNEVLYQGDKTFYDSTVVSKLIILLLEHYIPS